MSDVLYSAVLRARYANWTPRVVPEKPKPKAPSPDPKVEQARIAAERQADRKIKLDAAIERAKAMFPALPKPESPEMSRIRKIVADHYGFGVNEIVSPRRFGDLTHARHVAFYLCKTLTDRSFPQIGRFFGNRDHSTVLVAIRRMTERLKADPKLRETVNSLAAKIKGDVNLAT